MDNWLIFQYNLFFAQARLIILEDANCDFGQGSRNLMVVSGANSGVTHQVNMSVLMNSRASSKFML